MRDYARVNRMEVPEWKNRMEKQCKSREWKNRMEIVEMVDCSGWPFWASVLYPSFVPFQMHP